MMSQLQYPILLLNLFIEMFVYITVDEVVPVLLLEFENYLVKTVHKPLSSLFTAGKIFFSLSFITLVAKNKLYFLFALFSIRMVIFKYFVYQQK